MATGCSQNIFTEPQTSSMIFSQIATSILMCLVNRNTIAAGFSVGLEVQLKSFGEFQPLIVAMLQRICDSRRNPFGDRRPVITLFVDSDME